jgi:hypothetical protein
LENELKAMKMADASKCKKKRSSIQLKVMHQMVQVWMLDKVCMLGKVWILVKMWMLGKAVFHSLCMLRIQ